MQQVGPLVGHLDGRRLEGAQPLTVAPIAAQTPWRWFAGHRIPDLGLRRKNGLVGKFLHVEQVVDRAVGGQRGPGSTGLGVVSGHQALLSCRTAEPGTAAKTRSRRTSNSAAASAAPGRLPRPCMGSDWAAASDTAARRWTDGRQLPG